MHHKSDLPRPAPGLTTRATTLNFWHGFTMMLHVSTILIGYAGHRALFVRIVAAPLPGA